MNNPYDVLGVNTSSTDKEIKSAYRRLAKKHHPDVRSTGGDTSNYDPDVEKFRDVVEAYQVLSVKESRSNFDLSRKKNKFTLFLLISSILESTLVKLKPKDK